MKNDDKTSDLLSWYVCQQDKKYGPFSKSTIASMLAAGRISSTALLWREGIDEWVPVTNIIPPQSDPTTGQRSPQPYESSAVSTASLLNPHIRSKPKPQASYASFGILACVARLRGRVAGGKYRSRIALATLAAIAGTIVVNIVVHLFRFNSNDSNVTKMTPSSDDSPIATIGGPSFTIDAIDERLAALPELKGAKKTVLRNKDGMPSVIWWGDLEAGFGLNGRGPGLASITLNLNGVLVGYYFTPEEVFASPDTIRGDHNVVSLATVIGIIAGGTKSEREILDLIVVCIQKASPTHALDHLNLEICRRKAWLEAASQDISSAPEWTRRFYAVSFGMDSR